jgi:DNA-directed RNA polymerase specialized sigma subunit
LELTPSLDETDSISDVTSEWEGWSKDQSPDRLRKLVKRFKPTYMKALSAFGSTAGDTAQGQARLMVARAIKSYDPQKGANLNTHVYNSLRSLQRKVPMLADPMPVPERVRLDSARIRQAEAAFEGQIGRPPTDEELSELVKLTPKKIQRVRGMAKGRIPFSVIEEKADEDDTSADIVGSSRTDFDTWREAVYYDLGEQDRFIMSARSGYGDTDVLDNNTIAERLGVSPAYVSQRAAAIQRKLDEYHG